MRKLVSGVRPSVTQNLKTVSKQPGGARRVGSKGAERAKQIHDALLTHALRFGHRGPNRRKARLLSQISSRSEFRLPSILSTDCVIPVPGSDEPFFSSFPFSPSFGYGPVSAGIRWPHWSAELATFPFGRLIPDPHVPARFNAQPRNQSLEVRVFR